MIAYCARSVVVSMAAVGDRIQGRHAATEIVATRAFALSGKVKAGDVGVCRRGFFYFRNGDHD
jgi:hypothetical protein